MFIISNGRSVRSIIDTYNWNISLQVVTDQNPQEIAVMTVREKFLDLLGKEIPYTLHFKVEYWDLSDSGKLYEEYNSSFITSIVAELAQAPKQ